MNRRIFASAVWTLLLSVFFAIPAHAQFNWTPDAGNPVIAGSLVGGYALAPSVLYDTGAGVYRMWFTTHQLGGPWSIDYALSDDGAHWFLYAKNPVLTGGSKPFESTGVIYGGVVYDGSQYRMYYTGLSGCCGTAVGLATSPDGITWTKYAGNPVLSPSASGWDSGHIGGSTGVCFDGSTYWLLYQGVGPSSAPETSLESAIRVSTIAAGSDDQQIGLATSTDGVTFTKSATNPVIPHGGTGAWDAAGVFPGGLFIHDGVFYAFYGGSPADFSKENLGLATSSNGFVWVKDPHNPVFGGGAAWDWNIGSGAPVLRGSTIRLWYGGNSQGGNNWSIGYAAAPFELPTSVLASLVSAAADENGVHLVWEVTIEGPVTLFRRAEGSTWTAIDTRSAVAGRVEFDDPQVTAGVRYVYAIGRGPDASVLLAGDAWIEVPVRATLELRGAQPNPAPDGITASFVLPHRGRATLELFDLAGRRVGLPREAELGAGVHLLPLDRTARTTPGVYLLRMKFEDQVLESRVVVAR